MGKTACEACKKKCKGQAIKLQEKFFHLKCFNCKECKRQLTTDAFFAKDSAFFCADDYQRLFGTRCRTCGKFVEGEVVTALGYTYHPTCFHCTRCNKSFGAGDKVTMAGTQCLCMPCLEQVKREGVAMVAASTSGTAPRVVANDDQLLRSSFAPVTSTPNKPPNSLMVVDVQPLNSPTSDVSDFSNERSHAKKPPLRLSSGYKSDYSTDDNMSPVFVDVAKANEVFEGHHRRSPYRIYKEPLTPIQNIMQYRSPSPAISSTSKSSQKSRGSTGSLGSRHDVNYGKFYKASFLDKDMEFKKGQSLNLPAKPKPRPQFHQPPNFSYRKVRKDFSQPVKRGMFDTFGKKTYIVRKITGPAVPMNNKEAIDASKYPDAHPPEDPKQLHAIEREDWPGPPHPAAAYPELLRERSHRRRKSPQRRSDLVDGASSSATTPGGGDASVPPVIDIEVFDYDEDEQNGEERPPQIDPKTQREIDMLTKLTSSGAAQVLLKDLTKKAAVASEPLKLDPRSSSRTPSASYEPPYKTRYESPIFASPSRLLDFRLRVQSMDDEFITKKYRTSTLPISNFSAPKPGYGLTPKSATLPPVNGTNGFASYSMDGMNYFQQRSSGEGLERRSPYTSQSSVEEPTYDPHTGLKRGHRMRSASAGEGLGTYAGFRRSVPSLFKSDEPPKIYPFEQLKVSNLELPPNVDRNELERNLSKEEFEKIFRMSYGEFYRLAEWKRNDMKRRVDLF